ncbi:THAP domain containing protein 5 [Dissostichus eleginoides]|uniref:THAP domain containing protein 5 n=1 Tax=Dissostichus eleginoides TaxID=100907 RepID=A0AAD9CF03_DISEL|nr:THAP domain containing protein 5 [Dissostichus eleginoides]
MPKYCTVPNCRNESGPGGDRKSFYKFPLQDPARLQQWLSNMRRGNWTPSRHQYICHEHFTPSCFKVRWGIRYLESDAVPTIFQEVEVKHTAESQNKREATDHSERKPKQLRANSHQSTAVETDSTLQMVHLYEITVDPHQRGETNLVELSDVGEPGRSDLTGDGFQTAANFPLTLFQTVNDVSNSGEVVVMSECPAEEITGGHETQVIAYFEAIPSALPAENPDLPSLSPDTMLSSALSSKPISSTLPIVSKHLPPSPKSLVLTMERQDTDEGGDDMSEEDATEQQLEEHCYHKNSLSKEQLEAIVSELQKKVKVLQQRHRRHLEKLLGLENTVSQLRQNNLLNEERLQLLEKAYIQSSAAVSDSGEMVTIMYEADDAAYLYTPLVNAD